MTALERYAVFGVFLLAVTLGVVFNVRQSADQGRTERVVCEGLADDIAGERDRLEAYAAEPPQTPAGQAQQQAAEQALRRFEDRAERLGCNG